MDPPKLIHLVRATPEWLDLHGGSRVTMYDLDQLVGAVNALINVVNGINKLLAVLVSDDDEPTIDAPRPRDGDEGFVDGRWTAL